MSAELLPVWSEIEKYLDWGISVIPVRDKPSGSFAAKTPYGQWKQYQEKIVSKNDLFEMMDTKYNTTSVALVCGKVSGNLEVIDIDVKYKEGIDATLFMDLKELYPDILRKCRVHRSVSGGFHILYRCEEIVGGNQKLAGREKTEEELKENKFPKTVNFIETRGEGGYVLAPPSFGYSVSRNVSIPTLTKEERDSLLSVCRSYNEIIKPDPPTFKSNKAQDSYYDTNPFEDFNQRCDPTALMDELGWKYFKHSNRFIWYTRPGKSHGVSMSFNLQKRFFYCFTASTQLEENKGYSPANVLGTIVHGGDKKRLYADLVNRGFGVIKPRIEKALVKRAAINEKPLPANVSKQAVEELDRVMVELSQKNPYGVFWIDNPVKGVQIDREKLYRVAEGMGFYIYDKDQLVFSDGKYLYEVDERHFCDTIKSYIQEEDADFYRDICNAYESFIEKHGKFTISRLPILSDDMILHDTRNECYKPYRNGVLKITRGGYTLLPQVDKLIWMKSVKGRDFVEGHGGMYLDFLNLATEFDDNPDYIKACVGYLAHEYKDETMGYIIVLTEQCENPKEGGGAGKNVFSILFKEITTLSNKPGEQVAYDEKFLQSWNRERVLCISDAPEHFNFSFLKELSTGHGIVKKLFKNEREIPPDKMPKFLIQTNFSVDIKDGGLKRRIKMIEFTDFFTKTGGVDVHFDAYFPVDWEEQDWAGFDTFMAESVQHWLAAGRKIGTAVLSESGWQKQFDHTYGSVVSGFISRQFEDWCSWKEVANDDFARQLEEYYREMNIPPRYRPSTTKINTALKEYCGHKKISYRSDVSMRMLNTITKGRMFGVEEDLPF